MKDDEIKLVEIEYIESGAFQGSEEHVFNSDIEYGETCYAIRVKDYKKMQDEIMRLELKLRDADKMAEAIDRLVERNALDARSLPADARLNYGTPFKYEFSL